MVRANSGRRRARLQADDRRAGADGQYPKPRRVCSRTGAHDVFGGLDATAGEERALGRAESGFEPRHRAAIRVPEASVSA
jgi:hypothetical protein